MTSANKFSLYCAMNRLDDLKELCNTIQNDVMSYDFDITNFNSGLEKACKNGHLDIMTFILEKYSFVNISYNDEYLFRLACKYGHLHICKYLLSINPNIDMSICYNYPVITALDNSDFELLKWLLVVDTRTTRAYITCINSFMRACFDGKLELAKWLLDFTPTLDITGNNHCIFRRVMHEVSSFNSTGQIEVAKWLQSLYPEFYEIYPDKRYGYSYTIRTNKEAYWYKIKYAVWLTSNQSPNKESIMYKIPQDVSRHIISMI